MIEPPHRATPRIVSILCAFVALLAIIVLAGGWLLDVARLRAFSSGWSPMTPLTAVLLLLVSAASAQFQRRPVLSNVLLVLVFVVAAGVLINYFTGAQLELPQLNNLFRRPHEPLPELPAPDAAAAFMMLALALFCLRARNMHAHDFADVVAATIGIVCLQVLISYVYELVHSPIATGYRQIAPQSTLSVTLLAVTVVAQRPSDGMYAAMTGSSQSALLLRRLLPITVLSCLLVGLLEVEALRARVGGTIPEIVAWSITGAIVLLALLLFVTSASMRETEAIVLRREQDLLAATQAAEAASHTKSRFMAVMSHELRTPLTAMLGYADLLDAGVAGRLSPESRKFVDRIRSSGWHLVGLIDAVLLYASGRPAGEQIRNDNIELLTLIREVAESFESQAGDKGIALVVHAGARPIVVWSERARLREVLVNLISNAVKFTEQGSVTISVAEPGDQVIVDIVDTGIGIDAQHLAHIWEPFEQIDDPHTREHGGMGLGMALTRLLAEQMSVPLNVESEVGKGTTVRLTLARAAQPQTRDELRLDGVRVLVVDDEPSVRRIMARALARYGATITEAHSAHEALDLLANGTTVDAIVTDISMPGMNGIDLARTLRSRGHAPPLLFVTGAELSDADRAQIDAMQARLLNKPFDMTELAHSVLQLVRS